MKALTLHQPWAWCFTHAGKRLENRDWKPYGIRPGDYVALHAGKGWDPWGFEVVERADHDLAWAASMGLVGEVPAGKSGFTFGAVVAVVRYLKTVSGPPTNSQSQRFWWAGSYGWVFDEVHVLPDPVECRGYQKLWDLRPGAEAEVRQQMIRAERVWTVGGWGAGGGTEP